MIDLFPKEILLQYVFQNSKKIALFIRSLFFADFLQTNLLRSPMQLYFFSFPQKVTA